LDTATQASRCIGPLASVIDKSGYWGLAKPQTMMNVICTKDALNEFTPNHMCSPKTTYDSKVITTNNVHTCPAG
ncbi:hypothetical protein PMAYCL1PPCAC_26374, partial [Pristionchus mayeri]